MDVSGVVTDVAVSTRLIIGAVLLLAGIFKIRRRARTEAFIGEIGVPSVAVPAAYWMAVACELVTGILLMAGFAIGATMATALFVVFLIALVRTRSSQQPCACLGGDSGSDSFIRKIAPRVGGLVACLALGFNWEAAQGFPSNTALVLAGLPLVWIVRPRRAREEFVSLNSTTSETSSASGLKTEGRTLEVDRRAALQKVGGLALAGLAIPATRLGNLFGVRCICQDPCPRKSRCYASPNGQCYCKPYAVDDVEETVYDEIIDPEPDPPCDCECQYDHDLEYCGSDPGDRDCIFESGCAFNCANPAAPDCAASILWWGICLLDCFLTHGTRVGPCEAEAYLAYAGCKAENGAPDSAPWAERAWLSDALFRETLPVTIAGFVALSPAFELSNRGEKRFYQQSLETTSEGLLMRASALQRVIRDRSVMSTIERSKRLGRFGIALSQELGGSNGASEGDGIRMRPANRLTSAGVSARSRKKPRVRAAALSVDRMQRRLQVSNKLLDEQQQLMKKLQIHRDNPFDRMLREWRRDFTRLLREID